MLGQFLLTFQERESFSAFRVSIESLLGQILGGSCFFFFFFLGYPRDIPERILSLQRGGNGGNLRMEN